MASISDNLARVRERIQEAARRSRRDPEGIRLVAVAKTKPSALIREAFEAGQRLFGENYAQELAAKAAELSDLPIVWHFIGHLQRNKAKIVAPLAHCIETVDSVELAEVLDRRVTRRLACLIEVNVGGEESKSGVGEEEVVPLARHIVSLKNLDLCGLMIVPPYDADPEKSRPHFKKIKGLLAEINDTLRLESPLRELSMGMSHDLEVAIEEGATILRVGTAIFGERE